LPVPNLFIPTDFNILPIIEKEQTKAPQIIYDTDIIRVWFKQDTEYLKPKTMMNFDFSNPIVYLDPLNCNLAHLFSNLFKDHLTEYLYAAELAGLKLNFSNTTYGITVCIFILRATTWEMCRSKCADSTELKLAPNFL
jgi:insulysin